MSAENCSRCGNPIQYWVFNCPVCRSFVGFPNVRAAEGEFEELENRYVVARNDAQARGVLPLLERLEAIANGSRPAIAMLFEALDNVLRSRKYLNYDKRRESGDREPAEAKFHAEREMVSARLFPMYFQHIHYAALSTDGRGLGSYGSVSIRWNVTEDYLEPRISLLDENAYTFYDRYSLGRREAEIPAGHRAVWRQRAHLVAAKLAERLSNSMCDGSLGKLILHDGATRADDDFVEVTIFAEEGVRTIATDMVTLHRAPNTEEEHHRWALAREMCRGRGIQIVESV